MSDLSEKAKAALVALEKEFRTPKPIAMTHEQCMGMCYGFMRAKEISWAESRIAMRIAESHNFWLY